MNYLRTHLRLMTLGVFLIAALLIGIPVWGETFPPPPDTTPEPPKDIIVPTPTGEIHTNIFEATGESTKGALITVAGKKIQLPSDAYIVHDIIDVVCVIGGDPCPETPLYMLARSKSTIVVSVPSGIIYEEKIGDGDKEPFAFLKKALQ